MQARARLRSNPNWYWRKSSIAATISSMEYQLEKAIEVLERTPRVLRSLLSNLSEEWSSGNEGKDTWSAYDIVGHLIHGERTDWITRIKIILSDGPDKLFPRFDRFAQFRESEGKSLPQLLDEFEQLRAENLRAFRGFKLTTGDLQREAIHPTFGKVTLSQLLSTWVVHDLNHLAQIERVMAKQYMEAVGPWVEFLPLLTR